MEIATNKIEIEVIGSPVPQGSLVGNPRFGMRYTNDKALKSWRQDIIFELMQAKPKEWNNSAPMAVRAEFRFTRPKSHYGKKGLRPSAPEHKSTRPDLDKIVRACGDSLQESSVVRDDSQIVQWSVLKRWTEEQEPPGVLLIVTMCS
tara:strand:+ start:3227 stop:3667 length:441 start_codon:yes stop_codon:yes gene_type:complete